MQQLWRRDGWRVTPVAEGLRPKCGRHTENFCWYDLRHTWASWHVMEGTPLEVLQRLGGWRSFDMVLLYAHLAPGHIAGYSKACKLAQIWHTPKQRKTLRREGRL
ncbi:MAG: tyrosine-type recombinase/integrase [Lysobacterales bacterium]